MSDVKKPADSKLKLRKESIRHLRVHTNMRTGLGVQSAKMGQGFCDPSTACDTHGGGLIKI